MVKKVVLTQLTSGFNIAKIQNNFEKIENSLNDGVLWRNTPPGANENALQNDIDANGKRIINLPAPVSNTEPVRLGDVADLVQAVQDVDEAVAQATTKASEAAGSAAAASSSETNAANSATQAQNFSNLAASNSRLEIGTVTTVAPGTPASASITGAPGDQELSLVIPQGVQGIPGDPGPPGESADPAEAIHTAPGKATPADADELGYLDSASSFGLVKMTWANLKTWLGGLFVSKSGDTINGDLNFSGAGRRIAGDFSNVSVASRTAFQSSSINGITSLAVLPNGSGTAAGAGFYTNQDPENSESLQVYAVAGAAAVVSSVASGTGVTLPLSFQVGGAERLRIDPTTGNVLVTGGGGLGYGVGSGGTVTQATSKSTPVTLNKPSGKITMFNGSLTAASSVDFTLSNSFIGANDTVIYALEGFPNYRVETRSIGAGAVTILVTNVSGGALSEAVRINFSVIKGATS